MTTIPATDTPRGVKAALAVIKLEQLRTTDWSMPPSSMATLIGVDAERYEGMIRTASSGNIDGLFDDAVYERMSVLLGIFKGLCLIEPSDVDARFFERSNSHFGGRSIKEVLLQNPTIQTFKDVRRYLNARR